MRNTSLSDLNNQFTYGEVILRIVNVLRIHYECIKDSRPPVQSHLLLGGEPLSRKGGSYLTWRDCRWTSAYQKRLLIFVMCNLLHLLILIEDLTISVVYAAARCKV
jgi:hypothetical protein